MKIIEAAITNSQTTLSEFESKQLLAAYRIPVTRETLVKDRKNLLNAIAPIGYPVVLKGCSSEIAHKTEKGLIRVDIRNDEEAIAAFGEITAKMRGAGNAVLVQEMIRGKGNWLWD